MTFQATKKTKYQIATDLDNHLLNSGIVKQPIFTPLNEITDIKESFFFNILVIIERIEPIKMLHRKDKPPLELLNIYINDQSDSVTRLSFWGKQALNFKYSIGDILMCFDVDVYFFNFVSLRVNKKSKFMLIEKNFKMENAEKLREWWLNKKNSIKS